MLRGGENEGLGNILVGWKGLKEKPSTDENRRSEMQNAEGDGGKKVRIVCE